MLAAETTRAERRRLSELGLSPPPDLTLRADPFDSLSGPGCGVVPTAWHAAAPVGGVDAGAVRSDLAPLHAALRQSYAGYGDARRAGWDWDGFFRDWSEALGAGAVEAVEAFRPWQDYQRAFPDRHTGPLLGESTPRPRTALFDPPLGEPVRALRFPGAEVDLQAAARRARVQSAWLADTAAGGALRAVTLVRSTSEAGPVTAALCGSAWVDALPIQPGARAPATGVPRWRRLSEDVGYLSLPAPDRLSPSELPRPQPCGRLVCDLRGNRGGSSSGLLEPLAGWLGQGLLEPFRTMDRTEVAAPLTAALHWGAAQALLATARPPLPERVRAQAQALLDGLAAPPAERRERRHAGDFSLRGPGRSGSPQPGRPRLIVLVDDDCGSDGELVALLLASRPGALLVGPGTAGACGYGRPGRMVLPASRVPFQVATARFDALGGGRAVDGLGLPSDVLPAGPLDDAALVTLSRVLDAHFR